MLFATDVPLPDTQTVMPSYEGAFFKMMLTLALLLVFIFISVWLLRRLSRGRLAQLNNSRSIKILERRPLSGKSILYLVEVEGKRIVIAESQLEVRPLATLPEESSPRD